MPPSNAGFKLRDPSGEEFEITGPFRIGRDDECQIKVDNSLASRIHASIWVDHGQLLVRDERSRNGTYVNGRRIEPGASHRVYADDRIQIVGVTYIVVTPPPPFEPPKTLQPSPGFVAPHVPASPARAGLPRPALYAACGCGLLLVLALCVAGGFFLTARLQPLLATRLAPAATATSLAANTSAVTVQAQPTPTPPPPPTTAGDDPAGAAATQTQSAALTQAALANDQAATQTADANAAVTQAAAQTATAQGNDIFTLSGVFNLRQSDDGCTFSDAPETAGIVTLNVDFIAGTARLSLSGGGGAVRTGLRCNDSTGNLTWDQDYSAELTGPLDPATGALTLSGELTGENKVSWHDCRLNGQPADCAPSYANPYTFNVQLTGTVDRNTHTATGAWQWPDAPLPTSGDWSAGQ